jgi:hypothetical protein
MCRGHFETKIGEPISSSAESPPMTISYPTATCQALVRVSYALSVRSEPLHWFCLQPIMKKPPTVARTTASLGAWHGGYGPSKQARVPPTVGRTSDNVRCMEVHEQGMSTQRPAERYLDLRLGRLTKEPKGR